MTRIQEAVLWLLLVNVVLDGLIASRASGRADRLEARIQALEARK